MIPDQNSTHSRIASKHVLEAPEKHTHTVIFLHGFGERGEKWIPIATDVLFKKPALRYVKFIFPTAVERMVTLWEPEGRNINAWFDIPSWNDITFGTNDEQGMREAISCVEKLVESEVQENGIPIGNIFVGGFSQGGSLSLLTGLIGCRGQDLGGIFALASYMPMIEKIKEILVRDPNKLETLSRNLHVFMGHGNGDPQVKWNWGQRSHQALLDLGLAENVIFKTYKGVFHHVCEEEISDLGEWIVGRIGRRYENGE